MESSVSVENSSTHSFTHVQTPNDAHFLYKVVWKLKHYTLKPQILNTLKEFMKCRLDNFSMDFILFYVNLNICENK